MISFQRLADWTSQKMGSAGAFMLASIGVAIWAFSGPIFHFSSTWQLVINTSTTVLTFLMVFLIQGTQNRNDAAVQLKLDELILRIGGPRDEIAGVEIKTQKEIEAIKAEERKDQPEPH